MGRLAISSSRICDQLLEGVKESSNAIRDYTLSYFLVACGSMKLSSFVAAGIMCTRTIDHSAHNYCLLLGRNVMDVPISGGGGRKIAFPICPIAYLETEPLPSLFDQLLGYAVIIKIAGK